ncbi:MAG: hypothetical protein D6806_01815 [Deltaproteobacteria bacterium]|nr:MAG: hypothetical protein D6806_01815 [Deltaproteobacteria bacterium]
MKDLFAGVRQRPISIRGSPAKSPLFFRDLSMMMAVVTVDREAAEALVPGLEGYRVLAVSPRRALVGINCFRYRDTDVGPYDEVSIAVAIRPPGSRTPGALIAARAAAAERYHAFVHDLPVTTEIAVAGGVDFLNFPKWLARIDFEQGDGLLRCRTSDPGSAEARYAFEGEILQTTTRPKDCTFYSYPVMDGRMMRAEMRLRRLEWGRKLFEGFRIAEGTAFDRLKPGRVLLYVYAPRCQAILFEPEPVEPEE